MKFLTLLVQALKKIETFLLVSLLLILIGFSLSQILMRNFMDTGFIWGEYLIRILVLWIGLLGAMYAGRTNKHIRIDLVTHYVSEKWQRYIEITSNFTTAVICGIACWYSLLFVLEEYEYADVAFASVPVWSTQIIIPFSLAVLTLRFLAQSFKSAFYSHSILKS